MTDALVEPVEGSGVHPHPGLLAVACAGLCIGVLAMWLPSRRFATSPDIVGWLVGVVLLACGVFMVGAVRRTAGAWLIAAALAWHLSDLARLLPADQREVGQRSSLVHVALLGGAVVALGPRPTSRWSTRAGGWAGAALAVVAVSGWTGGWHLALPFAGVAVVVMVGVTLGDRFAFLGTAGAAWAAAGAVFGVELFGSALVRRFFDHSDVEPWLLDVHQLAVAAVSVLLAVSVARAGRADVVDLRLDKLAGLDDVVARALGVRSVSTALAAVDEGWLDTAGRTTDRPAGPCVLIEDEFTGRVALLGAVGLVVDDVPDAVRRVLRLARDHVRLRATIVNQVAELEASRRRILTAQDHARREVHEALRSGPLSTLEGIEHDVARFDTLEGVRHAVNRARSVLDQLADDLDPVADRSLDVALSDVVESSPAHADLRVDPLPDLAPEVARTVWFTVSEALANAVKHAPGAGVSITVAGTLHETGDVGVVVTVHDDGPGGANPSGSGLLGLRDRIDALGGTLRIANDPAGGTRLEVRM